ncbi:MULTISPECIES: hypothetical protein [Paenarthrobacter]|uniref:Uncharacterized protein n=1 Tax=Paenarthrobacter ureafaciens TaxID=37931 RepID=A0AAX3EEJ0_PAEUR|nr:MULTISPECIES: hypothetical protein [Paenarthrobacter]NKR13276.1 hypothetical protein [Arthrobacter sp. M5]NKR14874.1 hypothetical protein [Arthrobacter sp. M6]OEH62425.1 hypothetical protein A5N13_01850 [Arthrobacter sp. D4]OEH62996.1 hypothetical protein A5N17_10090 [Arthrobacter sp. D2]MDO5865175.1 hypothetical protein [Paenarthrobacter sp. SD-2]
MTDHDETNDGPQKDPSETPEKPSGIVARLQHLYEDRPVVFAVLVMVVSGLVFILGGVLTGAVDLIGISLLPMDDMP